MKPAKAAFSVLARRVDSFEELRLHTRFGWFEAAIIERLVQPFADVMREHSTLAEDPFSMVCEELVRGRQVTANGYAREGKVTMLGTVDSIMYPGTDQFQRFQYPSTLPPEQLRRVDAVATRLIEGMGFRHGMFNVEMRVDPVLGPAAASSRSIRAPRASSTTSSSAWTATASSRRMIELECGGEPARAARRRGPGPRGELRAARPRGRRARAAGPPSRRSTRCRPAIPTRT